MMFVPPPPPPYGRAAHQMEGLRVLMIKCVGKIRILPLKVQECPDLSILQTIYPYVAPMEELARNLKVWVCPHFYHHQLPALDSGGFCIPPDFLFYRGGYGY